MRTNSNRLCCCEYVDREGNRSHILTCCCNCQAFDEAFERFITCKTIDYSLFEQIKATLADRCRMPFPGGAKSVDFKVVAAVLTPISCLLLSTVHFATTLLSLLVLVAVLRKFSRYQSPLNYLSVLSLICSLVAVYAIEIAPHLDIIWYECAIIYISLLVAGCFLLLGKNDNRPSTEPSYHLSWFNCPVQPHNSKWLLIGSSVLIGTCFYASHLIFLTMCQTFVLPLVPISIPEECPEIYFDFHHSLSFQCGLYSFVGGILLISPTFQVFKAWLAKEQKQISII